MDQEAVWRELRTFAEAGDTDALLRRIAAVEDDGERITLYRFVIRQLAFSEWKNKSLDVMIGVADAAISDCEALGGDYLEQANIVLYNVSANLADCWGDEFARERRHFDKGLAYARRAVWYREHLSKPPGSKAMAWWAVGKHLHSLGDYSGALEAFKTCLTFEEAAAAEAGKPSAVSADAPPGYLIAWGWTALLTNAAEVERLWPVLDEMASRGGEDKVEADIVRGQLKSAL